MLAATTGIIGASVVLLALLGFPPCSKMATTKNWRRDCLRRGNTRDLDTSKHHASADGRSYGYVSGDLFLGAVFPGLLLSSLYIIYLLVYGAVRPELAPRIKNQILLTLRSS
ncbi:MAG: hypothetical protein CM1200mP24_03280 [Gammaproteobacteria bacterium]|nr:MAG: hypothetical protein CM1200mP24_03280 [Gammaproteobacteria bacterium]